MHVIDGYYDDAAAAARARQDETGALAMHPFDQPEVVAGQGTIGMELQGRSPTPTPCWWRWAAAG